MSGLNLSLFGEDDTPPDEADVLGHERWARRRGFRVIGGLDEAGRGPLCGPVAVAVVVLPEAPDLPGLTDSKLLNAAEREALFPQIQAVAVSWAVELVDAATIDRLNILEAVRLGAVRCFERLSPRPDLLLTDALKIPAIDLPQVSLIKGDRRSLTISAASVLAKVTRDRYMQDLEVRFPGYGLGENKGYPTAAHRVALKRLGPCPEHRRTFRGVREWVRPATEPPQP
jgi:ribonuclease HII